MKSMCLLFSRLACLLCLDQRHKIVIAEILASPFDRGLVCSSVQRPRELAVLAQPATRIYRGFPSGRSR